MLEQTQLFKTLGKSRAKRFGQVAAWAAGLVTALACMGPAHAADIPHITIQVMSGSAAQAHEGSVEAVRQAVIAAQVAGVVEQLNVTVGDRVRSGQVLLRIDARAAEQTAAASTAQVAANRASLEVAEQELNRKRQLYAKNYIAKAALEQAEANYRAAQAQLNAQSAQAGAARTQTGFHVVKAPFDGVVAAVSIERGDMAMPGRPLITVYDPQALRVTAAVPVTVLAGHEQDVQGARIELGSAAGLVTPARVQVLPTVDAASHTRQVRADLPAGLAGVVPGQYARLWLKGAGKSERLLVPQTAIVRRAELRGLYVLNEQGEPLLRQVRLGPVQGDQVEVLSGLSAGERVVTDPAVMSQAAGGAR
ncbi:efflux RND transporter periplasmic adaptor subunit [Ottowia caeni]|uniref:efflux RND transporter periplasmic adaptor subunit n=1 Tax=Ottowia caeni TaxID=2870339 RepID=UPI001E4CEC70